MKGKKKYKDFFQEAKKYLSAQRIQKAKARAHTEVFKIRLSELRQKQGINQASVKGFTQSAVSKLEARKDMKVSTLLEYLDSIGMNIEILVHSKTHKMKPISLLKSA